MAIGREWREMLTGTLGIPDGALKHVERRLGEAGLLGERGARGKSAPHLEAIHGARFLIGAVAAWLDGGQPGVAIARTVEKLGKMTANGGSRKVLQFTGDLSSKSLRDYRLEFGEEYMIKNSIEFMVVSDLETAISDFLMKNAEPTKFYDAFPRVEQIDICLAKGISFSNVLIAGNGMFSLAIDNRLRMDCDYSNDLMINDYGSPALDLQFGVARSDDLCPTDDLRNAFDFVRVAKINRSVLCRLSTLLV